MEIKNLRVHISLFLVSLMYAILFSWAGQIMPGYIKPEGFVWLRIITACVLFQITALLVGWEKFNWKEDGIRIALCALFGTAANMYLFFKGLSITTPINGAILMMVTPLFVAVFDHIRTNRIPSLETVIGLTIGAAGAIMLIAGKGVGFSAKTIIGDIMVAVNAFFYAIYLVSVKSLVHKYKPVTVNRITFSIGVLLMAPVGFFSLVTTDFQAIPTGIYLKIGYILFFTSFLVYLLNAYGVKHGSPKLVGVYIYLQPLLATMIALLLDRDTLTGSKVFYAAMILFGVWLVMASDKRVFSLKSRFQGK
jgi:drug/metabolite transporter (DMT)-like permease